MKIICQRTLDQIQPDEILAHDVLDAQSNCLLVSGAKLNAKTLSLLQRRGIKVVSIVQENELSAEQQEAWKQGIEQQLSRRFSQHQDNPDMQQLQTLLRNFRLGES
jgi:hypothetical protein